MLIAKFHLFCAVDPTWILMFCQQVRQLVNSCSHQFDGEKVPSLALRLPDMAAMLNKRQSAAKLHVPQLKDALKEMGSTVIKPVCWDVLSCFVIPKSVLSPNLVDKVTGVYLLYFCLSNLGPISHMTHVPGWWMVLEDVCCWPTGLPTGVTKWHDLETCQ